jgi:hypothetical protein
VDGAGDRDGACRIDGKDAASEAVVEAVVHDVSLVDGLAAGTTAVRLRLEYPSLQDAGKRQPPQSSLGAFARYDRNHGSRENVWRNIVTFGQRRTAGDAGKYRDGAGDRHRTGGLDGEAAGDVQSDAAADREVDALQGAGRRGCGDGANGIAVPVGVGRNATVASGGVGAVPVDGGSAAGACRESKVQDRVGCRTGIATAPVLPVVVTVPIVSVATPPPVAPVAPAAPAGPAGPVRPTPVAPVAPAAPPTLLIRSRSE